MADLLAPIMKRYQNFAMTSDGIPEINSLSYLPFESGYADPDASERVVLVLVEPRLLVKSGDGSLAGKLLTVLQRFKGDLRAEGFLTRFISTDLYRGSVHKDGRIVLALRQFFKDVKTAFGKFEGAILIGNFPEATLVRRVSWAPGWLSPRQLAVGTELISERAEIVLSDLTGNWENLYQQGDFNAEDILATPDATTTTRGWFDGESVRNVEFTSTLFTVKRSTNFRDAFFIDDTIYSILVNQTTPSPLLKIRLNQAENNKEVDSSDRSMVNILARPDISVSRINAYHIAVNPNPALKGADGHTFLDSSENPREVRNPTPLFNIATQHYSLFNHNDFNLERRLLISYFDRNHRFRNGTFSSLPFRCAVISGSTDFSPDWYEPILKAAATDFKPSLKIANATLREYVQFLKTPATFKYIMAHANSLIAQFRDGGDVPGLTAEAGGPPLRWVYNSSKHTPGFDGMGGNADIFIHRTLWHHNTLKDAGASLVIHGGCNVNSVTETQSETYTSPKYARWSNSEGFLFYTNCVALLSRAKNFNDDPNGLGDGYRVSDRANFGSCWLGYFNIQAHDATLKTYNIQRKRAYFWSINGDWTLRLRSRNGLGILSLDGQLRSVEVHPNRAWIDGWNYDAAVNRIAGIGDVDADGTDEFIITSDWGIAIVKYNGSHFRALMVAPRDTSFGTWVYDATKRSTRDRIVDIQDFTGSSRAEIMIWSSVGIATLEFNGTSLISNHIHANGTRFGGWLLNTVDNKYAGSGQFDNDSKKDVVLTSPRGLGIISIDKTSSIIEVPNGTSLGEWSLNTADNTVRLIADLDGDGMDEILISSPWGIGVLKISGGSLKTVAIHAKGSNLGGYVVDSTNTFWLADSLKGGAAKQILVGDPNSGIHMLSLVGTKLVREAFAANTTRIDGWVIDSKVNWLQRAGDMNGDKRAEFIIHSPWGVGIMGVDASNNFHCYSLFPFNSVLNDWFLQSGDVIASSGNLSGNAKRKELLIVKP